jgi:hypothetical protein
MLIDFEKSVARSDVVLVILEKVAVSGCRHCRNYVIISIDVYDNACKIRVIKKAVKTY